MEEKQDLLVRRREDPAVISALAIRNNDEFSLLIDGFDMLLLIVSDDAGRIGYTTHYIKDKVRIQERWVNPSGLEQWIVSGENRSVIQWILQGEIVVDRGSYLSHIKQELIHFPAKFKEQRLLIEFSAFLRKYLLCKQYLHEGHTLDAFSHILDSLQHWARIAIIEEGQNPEVTVWKQLRKINPGIYKLYEELTLSMETLEERVQLVLLACEFSVMSKMARCCSLLIKILGESGHPCSPQELMEHPELKPLNVDYTLVLHRLAGRKLIKEMAEVDAQDFSRVSLKYTV